MINHSLESCPLWLLFKCHKGFTWRKGTPPSTRGVMGGNQGMNSHLSEILSWALEPLADALLPKSSEVISNEDLKSNLDSLNQRNGSWVPDDKVEGDLGDVTSMMGAAMELPGWCNCSECDDKVNSVGENNNNGTGMRQHKVLEQGDSNIKSVVSTAGNAQECANLQSGYLSAITSSLPEGVKPGSTQSDQLSGQESNPTQSDQLSGISPSANKVKVPETLQP